ncbi:putative cyclin-dependent kinase inhibitor domain-containing protein [Dioscorea sansibarensis]
MRRYAKKGSGGVGELAVMEISPEVVGVRTRARTTALRAAAAAARKRKTAAVAVVGPEGVQILYLQLRSRSLVMTQRVASSTVHSDQQAGGVADCVSRCSSNATSEVVPRRPSEMQSCDSECNRARRESTPMSELHAVESDGGESTAGRLPARSTSKIIPPADEIEAFFAAAEREDQQRFTSKYNFDVVNDTPLSGRYDWVRLKP